MKLKKMFYSFGMIGTLFFLLEDLLGTALWKGYNPVTSYVSQLTADGAPNVLLTRTLFYIYGICLTVFVISLLLKSFQSYGLCLRACYSGLLLISAIALLGYEFFPMTMDFVINPKNYIHAVVTILILAGTICILFLLAFGYLKQEHEKKVGSITFVAAIFFLFFNLLHLYAIVHGWQALGLIERATLYTFHIYFFILSWIYTTHRFA